MVRFLLEKFTPIFLIYVLRVQLRGLVDVESQSVASAAASVSASTSQVRFDVLLLVHLYNAAAYWYVILLHFHWIEFIPPMLSGE